MICSSLNRDLFILSVSFVGTDSTSNWRRKRVSVQPDSRFTIMMLQSLSALQTFAASANLDVNPEP